MDSMEFSVEELVSFVEELPPEETLQAYEKGGTDFSAHSEQLEGKPKQKIRSTKTKSGRTTNVDRCRKYRDKRRKEEAQVYTENFELKQQRTELQRQIAELEVEVQTLRGQGVVNLSKENELLRREIEKHSRYIERVVAAMKETPLHVEEEEEQRLLKSGIESAVGHTVGMMYSSMTDSSWTEGPSVDLFEGLVCKVRFQVLPTGCDFESAQRVNLRMDCEGIQCSAQELFDHGTLMAREIDKWEAVFKAQDTELLRDIQMEEVHPAVQYDDDEFISCSRMYNVNGEAEEDIVFVHAAKTVNIYQTAFHESSGSLEDVNCQVSSEECKLLVTTNTGIAIKESPNSPSVKRPEAEFHSEGFVVRTCEGDHSSFTLVTTQPVPGATPGIAKLIIDSSGELNNEFVGLLRDSMALLIHRRQDNKGKTDA